MTITTQQIGDLTGKVYSQNAEKIGGIGQVYLDDETGAPSWVTVKTGLFGSAETFVPLDGARVDGNDVHVDFAEDKIKDAPRVDADGSLSPEEEDHLYDYYGLSGGGSDRVVNDGDRYGTADRNVATDVPTDADDASEVRDDRPDRSAETVGADRSGPTTDDAMTRSEERVSVGTATREAGRARLRKYVTSENVTETVPVRHEEVTLEREPITEGNYDASQSGPSITEEEHEVVLHEEVPVVDKDVVAVERVKLGKETTTEDVTVSEDVRKEHIELDDQDTTGKR